MSRKTVQRSDRPSHVRHARSHSGFTLIETLVVISIMAVLTGILLPAVSSARRSMKKLGCASNMRSVTLGFQLFVNGDAAAGRGDSERLGRRRFYINDFQESVYRIDEFWDLHDVRSGTVGGISGLLLCPQSAGLITKRSGFPCGASALTPTRNVAVALNMRLYRAAMSVGRRTLLSPVALTTVSRKIVSHPYVPLAIDVDGHQAVTRGVEPFYTAPQRPDEEGPYSDGRYWMPSSRHAGKTNVAFVGGHVLSSTDPAAERWDWGYQANVGR